MKKLFLIISFVLFLAAVIVLSVYKIKKSIVISDYQLKFSSDLISSNLYSPDNLEVSKVGSESLELTWDFADMHLVPEDGSPPEYANLSGYRIYRNGYWYKDLSGSAKVFSDTNLYPGKSYSYQVSALTFDNKIEGEKSVPLSVTTTGNAALPKSNLKIGTVLIEGDSITKGEQANPGSGWADQVGTWLTKNGSMKIYKDAVANTFSFDLAGRIGKEILSVKPDLVIIGVGMNDLFAGNGNVAHYSLGEYLQNYGEIIQLCRSYGATVVAVGITSAKGKENKVKVWNSALEDLSYNTKSIYIPTDYLPESDLIDSIHPNQDAHDKIAQKMISVLYTYFR